MPTNRKHLACRGLLVALTFGACTAEPPETLPPDAPPPVTQPPGLSVCDGNCANLTATVSNGTVELAFARAYFGITTQGAAQTLYLEMYRGGDAGCPTQNSPTPAQTLILSALPVFTARNALGSSDGLASSVLDFTGDLTPVIAPSGATALMLTPRAISLAPPSFVAFDYDNAYENDITSSGHVYATYCASLDASL